jgi:hypothetical protein
MKQEVKDHDRFETRSILCMPIVNGQKSVIGVAQLINKVGAIYFREKSPNRLRGDSLQVACERLISFLLADEWHAIHRL